MSLVELDPTSDRPLSLQLADLLREEIASSKRLPGDQLPTESGFKTEYGVSRTTVRAALAQLTSEGLVIIRKGYGSYVRNRPPVRRVSSSDRHAAHRASGKSIFETEALAQGQKPLRRILQAGPTKVPPDIAEWLQVPAGECVIVRRRLHFINDHPVTLSAGYFPLWLAKGTRLESSELIFEGPDGLIEALGHRFARGIEVFRARMPTPDEARILRLDRGIPVVRMLHIDYDPNGRTLQVADDLYAGDRHEFAFQWNEPQTIQEKNSQ
ncbi:MAG: GntR family transcriptional regulator [Candidatus Dormibacteraceae bacterium]